MKLSLSKLLNKPELVFVGVSALFGLMSVFMMPILSAPDEALHFLVEYGSLTGSSMPDDLINHGYLYVDDVKSAIIDMSYFEKYFSIKDSIANDGLGINIITNLTAWGDVKPSITDIDRLPQSLGIHLGRYLHPSEGTMVIIGRLANLFVYITFLYLIIKKVKYGKWVFVYISCLPIMIQQAGSLSYDAINSLVVFAWVAFIINLYSIGKNKQITKKLLILGIITAILILLTKPSNILLFIMLLSLPMSLVIKPNIITNIKNLRFYKYYKIIALISISIITFFVFVVFSQRLLAGQEFHPKRLLDVLLNTYIRGDNLLLIDVTTNGMIGYFSNFYYHLPIWTVIIAFIVLILIMLNEKLPNASKKLALISGGIFIGSILVISIGMYYAWAIRPDRLGPGANVTDGIQGRYFTPLLVLLFPVFAYLQKYIKIVTNSSITIPIIVLSTNTFLLLLYIYQTWDYFWRSFF